MNDLQFADDVLARIRARGGPYHARAFLFMLATIEYLQSRLSARRHVTGGELATWDEARREGVPLHISEYGKEIQYRRGDEIAEQISFVPSLIHYAADNRRWLGNQVLQHNLYQSSRTFRWMKRYIARQLYRMLLGPVAAPLVPPMPLDKQ